MSICGLVITVLSAQAFELVSTPSESLTPVREIVPDGEGVTVSYTFPGAVVSEDNLYPGTYRLDIPGFGVNMTPGEAAWPQRWDSFVIPQGCDASVELLSASTETKHFDLAPARPDLPNSGNEVYSTDNVPPVTAFSGLMPANNIDNGEIRIYRDRRILYVRVTPVAYRNEDGTTYLSESLSYRVNFTENTNLKVKSSTGILHTVDNETMSRMFSYYEDEYTESSRAMRALPTSADLYPAPYYLILSVPEYKTEVEKFAAWKRVMGFNVKIIYKNGWYPHLIKSTVEKNYKSLDRLEYLLLIGDEVNLPGMGMTRRIGTESYSYYTDFYYACMDGPNDTMADLFMGRLPISNSNEAKTVIDKIINYEKNPPSLSSFYKNAAHCAEFSDGKKVWDPYQEKYIITPPDGYEDRRFTRTSEDIRNGIISTFDNKYVGGVKYDVERIYYYNKYAPTEYPDIKPLYWNKGNYSYGEEIPEELKMPGFKWDGNATHVANSINKGIFYLLHRDHGNINGWGNPSFSISDISKLKNGNLTPVVFSMNCQTGMFQNANNSDTVPKQRTTCFAEAFLRKANGGCVAIIAATQTSFSGVNDAFTMELFSNIWTNAKIRVAFPSYKPNSTTGSGGMTTKLGKVVNYAQYNLDKYFGSQVYNQYTKELFHLFGDPSMSIYTREPKPTPYVCSNPTIHLNQPGSWVEISSDTFISLTKIYKNGNVETAYASKFNVPLTSNDSIMYVHGENMIPQKVIYGTIPIITGQQKKPSIHLIEQDGNRIKISFNNINEHDDLKVSMHSIDNANCNTYDCGKFENYVEADKNGLTKGIYIIDLIQNGNIVDSRKIILK